LARAQKGLALSARRARGINKGPTRTQALDAVTRGRLLEAFWPMRWQRTGPQAQGSGMTDALFRSLDSAAITRDIRKAQHSVCYAVPGIQQEPGKALAELTKRIGAELITICVDFDSA
jgi:hypothetical protein